MNKKYLKYLILGFILILAVYVDAQCPMCRMSAESNMANGGTEGKGLNNGILYLLSLPYLLVFILGAIWYKKRKKVH
jgi:hypothetical protein